MPNEKEKIIAIFEKHRKLPKTTFQEDHFLDFLLAAPKKKGEVRNSFSGLRRFNAFIDEIQSEFLVSFSFKDREANYSLEKFVARVQELKATPRSSLASLRNQMGPSNWNILIFFNIFMFPLMAAFRHHVVPLSVLAVLAIAVNWAIIGFYRRERRYNQQLLEKISARTNKEGIT